MSFDTFTSVPEIKQQIDTLLELNPIEGKQMYFEGQYRLFYKGNPIVAWINILTEKVTSLAKESSEYRDKYYHYKDRYEEILRDLNKIEGRK